MLTYLREKCRAAMQYVLYSIIFVGASMAISALSTLLSVSKTSDVPLFSVPTASADLAPGDGTTTGGATDGCCDGGGSSSCCGP